MLPKLTKKFTDNSNLRQFSFAFYCDVCKAVWYSTPIAYSAARAPHISWLERFSGRWKKEHDEALNAAVLEGMLVFNHCSECGRWVCDKHLSLYDNLCSICTRKKDSNGNL